MTKELTPQQIFDKVATHLFTQGKRSVSVDGYCLYRDGKGGSCAVGCLLTNTFYNRYLKKIESNMDNGGIIVGDLLDMFPVVLKHLEPHRDLLDSLQEAHDLPSNWENTETMRSVLKLVASKYNVNSDILNTLSLPTDKEKE